jgi:hypothetical protein
MADKVYRSWQAPPAETLESHKLGWLDAATEEGQLWQKAQRSYHDWGKALNIISGDESVKGLLDYRSQLSGRRLKTNIRVEISGLANIRPIWGWHATKAYTSWAAMLNKTARALYLEGYWDQTLKSALLWASATGCGFIRPVYRRANAGRGAGSIQLDSYGMPSVCPVQLPSDGDFQNAYAVTLLEELPIWMAHGMFPEFQDDLVPTESRYWYSAEIRTGSQKNAAQKMANWFGLGRSKSDGLSEVYIPIRYTTINDLSLNMTGHTIPMGQPGSSWYYEVPSLGQEISNGNGGSKTADMNDARMYPYRRLMISSPKRCMYDGPAFNWHGELDLIPFYLDWWPWEPMGLSQMHDGWELQQALDHIDRGSMEKVRIDLDRPLAYNLDAVTKKEASSFDPMEPRTRIGFDGSQVDKPFTSPVEDSFFQISETTLKVREILEAQLDYQLQTRELVELAKARALGKNMDDIQALVAASGPLVKDMSRAMEKPLSRIGKQVGSLILQWMDTSRLMQYVGAEGMVSEVFDYEPDSLIPSHMPGEATTEPGTENKVASKFTRMQRARWFESHIKHYLMPHSAHEFQQMTTRLILVQLKKLGLPISDGTIMQACEVPNVAEPDGGTEQEHWQKEQEEKIVFAARMQEILKSLGIDPSMLGGGPHAGGRPSSGKEKPTLKSKDGGSRSTISESG